MTPWTVARQAPLSMGFPSQEYWSGLPFLFPGDFPNTEIEPTSPVSPALQVGGFFTIVPTGKPMSQWSRICLLMQEMQEMQVWSAGQEDPLEKERATHFSILAWKIPWTEEPGRLQSMGSQKNWT